jgi:hypothetical protein
VRLQLGVEGGFASLPGLRERRVTVDVDALPPEQANKLKSLLQEADFFGLPERLGAPAGAADYREYTLTVDDGDRRHTVRVPEIGAPAKLLELIDKLQALQ